MTTLNDFSVKISDATPVKTSNAGTYMALPSGAEYRLTLTNNHGVDCDADVNLDGKTVGKWRVCAGATITVDSPADVVSRFMFLEEHAAESHGAVTAGAETNGLVEVTFYPRKKESTIYVKSERSHRSIEESGGMYNENYRRRCDSDETFSASVYRSGATVLGGGDSSQRFTNVASIPESEIDRSNVTTISIRLVVGDVRPEYDSLGEQGTHGYSTVRPRRLDD